MTYLTPSSDRIVRLAVDDYLCGRRRLELPPEAVLETRNSRYRFNGGRVVESVDDALMGAELVGWLEEDDDAAVQTSSEWRPGLRAILVDHQNHRHIVVTSQTRKFADARMVRAGSPSPQLPGSPLPRFESSPSLPGVSPAGPAPRVVVSEPTPKTAITRQPPAIPALPPAPARLTPTPAPVSVHAQAVATSMSTSSRGQHPKTRSLPPLALARPLPPPAHPPTRHDAPLPSFAVESSDRMPIQDADMEDVSSPVFLARALGAHDMGEDDCDDLAETNARPAAQMPPPPATPTQATPAQWTAPNRAVPQSRPSRRSAPPPPPRRRMGRLPQSPVSSN